MMKVIEMIRGWFSGGNKQERWLPLTRDVSVGSREGRPFEVERLSDTEWEVRQKCGTLFVRQKSTGWWATSNEYRFRVTIVDDVVRIRSCGGHAEPATNERS